MTQVFISYSRKDLVFAERLSEDLKAAGLEVWYDLSGLDGGTRWGREIQNAIEVCQIFVVVLSQNSVDSEWVEKEFMYANSLKKRIIPLLYQPCKTPMWFINLHFIDVQGENYDRNFWVILKAMGIKPGDKGKEIQPATDAHSIQAVSASQIPPSQPVETEVQKAAPQRRKIKIFPGLAIALAGLAALLAFVVWGLPALAARLAPTSTATPVPTMTATLVDTIAPTFTATRTSTPRPTLVPTSTLGVGSTWIRPSDGMVMVYVPAGSFSMGSNSSSSEQPIHTVNLDAFWIDKTEVTNATFANFVGDKRFTWSNTHSNYYGNPLFDNFPALWINWSDAFSYCQRVGARLPTEAEWEKAARGTDGRIYPWGNGSPTNSLLNYNSSIGDANAVGSYPLGASPYGALDMAGNVWEWVNDWFSSNYYASSPSSNPQGPSSGGNRVFRGGAFDSTEGLIRSATRGGGDPKGPSFNLGFRCTRSAK
jgi:formylglycine-generating enzyme required for sulfatase activity